MFSHVCFSTASIHACAPTTSIIAYGGVELKGVRRS
jgi:hypothetical protein